MKYHAPSRSHGIGPDPRGAAFQFVEPLSNRRKGVGVQTKEQTPESLRQDPRWRTGARVFNNLTKTEVPRE